MSELARPFSMSLPAVMKHLEVLSDAGLITEQVGRTVTARGRCPMEKPCTALSLSAFLSERLDRLAAFVEEDSCSPSQPRHQPSLTSNVVSSPAADGLRRVDRPRKILNGRSRLRAVKEAFTDVRVGAAMPSPFNRDGEQLTERRLSGGGANQKRSHLGVAHMPSASRWSPSDQA